MNESIKNLNNIEIEKIIEKYVGDKVAITGNGTYASIDPCPKCGHDGCCKINTDNNNLMCLSKCDVRYLRSVRVLQWLLDISEHEAILKLSNDFEMPLSAGWEEEYELYKKEERRLRLMTRFAELSHGQLNAEHRKYWTDRGFSDEIINRFLIGICLGDGAIYQALLAEGYTSMELNESGLFYDAKREYFTLALEKIFPYFTLPNWQRGRVVDIQGRYCGEGYKERGFPKYKTMTGEVQQLFNPDALKEDEVWIAEGIPDTLSMIQLDLDVVGTYGVNGVKDDWLPVLREKKTVYIAFDTDEAGAKNALKLARRIGDNAKIVSLPDVKDVNELLVKEGTEKAKEILLALKADARTAIQTDIDALPGTFDQIDPNDMKLVSFAILGLPPFRRDIYIRQLAGHFKVSKKLMDDTVNHYRDERKAAKTGREGPAGNAVGRLTILMEKDPYFHRLSQCFASNKVFYAQQFIAEIKTDETSYKVLVPRVITSDRVMLDPPEPVSHEIGEVLGWKIGDAEIVMRRRLGNSTMRWTKTGTQYSISLFLDGKEGKVQIAELYKQIEAFVRKHYHAVDEFDYVIISLFTLFTYIYELWDAVPYLYLNGSPESGKTTLCIVLQNLCFNGDLVSSITASSLFREAEAKQGTLIMDEQEKIASRAASEDQGDYLSVIKDGYRRTGTVKRQFMDKNKGWITEEFQVFGPLVIANVYGLEGIIKTRAIQITTKTASKEEAARLREAAQSDPEFINEVQLIRDQMYCWVMQSHTELRELPNVAIGDIVINRAKEIFQPLFALATYIESSEGGGELKLIEQLLASLPSKLMKRTTFKEREPLELLRQSCLLALADKGATEAGQAAWVSTYEIFDKLVELSGQYQPYMTHSWIGEKILSSGWITDKGTDRDRRTWKTKIRDPKTCLVTDNNLEENKKQTIYYLRYEKL